MTERDRMFLIVFDRNKGRSTIDDLGRDVGAAVETFRARERALEDREGIDVVLIGSPSLEVLRSTHSSYFDDADGLKAILASAGR
jgi:hypothetical protein